MKKKIKAVFSYLLFICMVILLIRCGNPSIVDKTMDVDQNSWDVNDKLKAEIQIEDTLSSYNFYINVRNTTDYSYSNFFLFIKTIFPNGEIAIDTLECVLADYQGKWLGKGHNKLRDNRILFKNAVIFSMKGKYVFEIEHAMRTNYVKGIQSIGLRIEKNKSQQ